MLLVTRLGLGNFDSYGSALFLMLLTITENGWSTVIFDIGYKFDAYSSSAIFFISFRMIVQMVFITLLIGLIHEIFKIVSQLIEYREINEKEKKEFKTNIDASCFKRYPEDKIAEAIVRRFSSRRSNFRFRTSKKFPSWKPSPNRPVS